MPKGSVSYKGDMKFFLKALLIAIPLLLAVAQESHAGEWNSEFCRNGAGSTGASNSAYNPTGSLASSYSSLSCANRATSPSGEIVGAGVEQTGSVSFDNSRALQWTTGYLLSGQFRGGWIKSAQSAAFRAVPANSRVCVWLNFVNLITGGQTAESSCINATSRGSWFTGGSPSGGAGWYNLSVPSSVLNNRPDGMIAYSIAIGMRCGDSAGCAKGTGTPLVLFGGLDITTQENIPPTISSSITGSGQSKSIACTIGASTCGTDSVSFSAEDLGSGPARVLMQLSTNGGSSWSNIKPTAITPSMGFLDSLNTSWPPMAYRNGVYCPTSAAATPMSTLATECVSPFAGELGPVLSAANGFNLDGSNQVRLCAYDLDTSNIYGAGLQTCSTPLTYNLSNALPPAPTITSGPSGTTGNSSPSFEWTGEAGGSFECNLAGPGQSAGWIACESPKSYSSLTDGSYEFDVRQLDEFGRAGDITSRPFAVSTSIPGASFSSSPASPTNDSTLNYTVDFTEAVTGISASSFSVSGTATGCGQPSPSSSSGTSTTVSVSGCSEGAVILSVVQNGVQGTTNSGPVPAVKAPTITIDRTAPGAPTITSGPGAISESSSAAFVWIGSEAGGSFSCALLASPSSCTSPATYTDIPDGERTFSVVQTDEAGNTSAPATYSFRVAALAPKATWTSPASPTNDAVLAYTIEFSESVSGIAASDFVNTGSSTGCLFAPSASSGSSVNVLASSCSEGTVSMRLKADSVVGASGPGPVNPADASPVVIDRTAPGPPIILSGPDGTTSNTNPSFAFIGVDGSTFSCSLSVSQTPVESGACTSPKSYSSLQDDPYTFRVVQTDPAGNQSAPAERSFTVDTDPPEASFISEPISPARDQTLVYIIGFSSAVSGITAEDFSVVGTSVGCQVIPSGTQGDSVSVSVADCSEGTVTLSLDADSVEKISNGVSGPPEAVVARAVRVDRTNPPAPTITEGPSGTTSNRSPVFEWTGESGGSFECRLGPTLAFVACQSPWSTELLANDNYEFQVRQIDEAGNVGGIASRSFRVLADIPTASWSLQPPSRTAEQTLIYEITFSQTVSDISASKFTIEGTATGCIAVPQSASGIVVRVHIVSCSPGTVVLRLKANSVQGESQPGPESALVASSVERLCARPALRAQGRNQSTKAIRVRTRAGQGCRVSLSASWQGKKFRPRSLVANSSRVVKLMPTRQFSRAANRALRKRRAVVVRVVARTNGGSRSIRIRLRK